MRINQQSNLTRPRSWPQWVDCRCTRLTLLPGAWQLAVVLILFSLARAGAAPLVTLTYRVTGVSLQVTPTAVSVPKNIPGAVQVSVVAGGSTNNAASAQMSAGAYVQAVLRGPAFPQPYVIQGAPNQPLVFPPISLDGAYELDDIKLVDAATGNTRLEGTPSSVPVTVFDQVLVSSVTSTPLTIDQIQKAGIVIDEENFSAVQFQVQFVLNGQTIPVNFPVVSPKFTQPTELIPTDQLEASLQHAAVLNQQIGAAVQLPPELQTANLNISVQGINFQVVDTGTGPPNLALGIPPIPALMVIPGNIGFLNQFFNVQIFTENGSPVGSGLIVSNVQASLILPPGPDGILSTDYNHPGDDPLRMARLGPNQLDSTNQPVVNPGPDGQLGTADDIPWLAPGQSGQGQFYVEGLQEGLWVMNMNLTAQLHGLANGVVTVKGQAAGSVLVRNPKFSLAFSAPAVVRVGEPYTATVTVLNTGVTPANLLSVSLNENSISGAVFAPGQQDTIQLGSLQPGQSATATFHLISETTGAVEFSNLSTSSDSVVGRFRLSMAVDAEGVALSPNSLALPDYVNSLPTNVLAAANRVLGQALSVATAAQLPAGVLNIPNATITTRSLELAEAGERLQYGDTLNRVLPDLLRDWQGGRQTDDGFDQLIRVTDAGAEWRSAIFGAMEADDGLTGTARLFNRAPDLAGLGQNFVIASAGPGQLEADFSGTTNSATLDGSTQPYAAVFGGTNGIWAVTQDQTNAVYAWTFTNAPTSADMAVSIFDGAGHAHTFRWMVANPPPGAVYRFALNDPTGTLQVYLNGAVASTVPATQQTISELPPTVIAVQQDLMVQAGRPVPACVGPNYENYGTVVAVVYSKPVTQQTAGNGASYSLDGNNGAYAVQIQPNGRVALLDLSKGISAIIPRTLTVSNVTDVDGNELVGGVEPVVCLYPGTTEPFKGGVAVTGRVLGSDGGPVAGVPVTLTMHDGLATPTGCMPVTVRVSQVLTDPSGNFNFDFVMSGIPYTISATDTRGLSAEVASTLASATVSTGPDDQLLQQLASASPNTATALTQMFGVDTVPQAIQEVDGLDRTLLNDSVGLGSGREGQTVPFVLRFRGRGTVTGQVVASDGVSPLAGAAVNLFPDPTSLELGRGMFADNSGKFSFLGVPLGNFTVSAATADGRQRTVAGILTSPGAVSNLVIALPSIATPFGTLAGQVFDSDNVTPVANASVYVGTGTSGTIKNVVAIAQTDAGGNWIATNIPVATFDLVAVTFDGKRKGERNAVMPVANTITYEDISLDAATTVFGRVQFSNGQPATNALVAGGIQLVRSDVNGNFQLEGVPVGDANISAGLEANPALGINFPRLGTARLTVIEGQANYVVVNLRPAGEIAGKVLDAQGNPVPGVQVAIPAEGGFYWTTADSNGNYVFENLAPGIYTLSAPANATAPVLDQSSLMDQISSGDEDQILAAFQTAINVFVGGEDPLINGADDNFRPSTWGYTSATIRFDGDTANADIHFLQLGSISGVVLNDQGVPIGARVELTGFGPDPTGEPSTTIRGLADSDPATGQFSFPNELFPGTWGLQAASPFYPVVISKSGFTTPLSLDVSNVVLQFPPQKEVNGVIAGHVYYPDGTAVGQGVAVAINVAPNYQIQTDTNGFFDTQAAFPAVNVTYTLQAFDSVTGLKGIAAVSTRPGITNFVDVHLLSRDSTVTVTVLQANGSAAPGAEVELDQGTYPYEQPLFLTAGTNGAVTFVNLWEGSYSAMAKFAAASTTLSGRAGGAVTNGQTINLTIRLGATGSLRGQFVESDLVTPVSGAEVAIGNLGYAATDTNGDFGFDGIPVGTYPVTSADPVTGGSASTTVTISSNGQTQNVQLVEASLGDINGYVINSFGTGPAAGATVIINYNNGFTPATTVTTGPNGDFDFPGSPLGPFSINVKYSLPDGSGLVTGSGNGSLDSATTPATVTIKLQPLASLPVQVLFSDGATPATNVSVTLTGAGNRQQDVNLSGQVVFSDLPIGVYQLQAYSHSVQNDGVVTNINVSIQGTNPMVIVALAGTGTIRGTVVGSDGTTPVNNAQVMVSFLDGLFAGGNVSALSDTNGAFTFLNVPVGGYRITAEQVSLAGALNGAIAAPGQTNVVTLQLGASGTVKGRLVRQDGVTPVGGQDVAISYKSQDLNQGIAVYLTADDGRFEFDDVPVGPFHISSIAASIGGIISFDRGITNNQQVLDLGDVAYDETIPQVVQVTPADTTIGVPITNGVQLVFNEAMDSNSISADGIFIQDTNGPITSFLTLQRDTNGVPRIVTIQPVTPLRSLTSYGVVVLSGDVPGPLGGILGSGPVDLVGRATAATFISHFTTADNTPPNLLSIFPTNGSVQIDPSAVPRLAFDKILQTTGIVFNLTGPQGPVAGVVSVGVHNQVVSFVPNLYLQPNATYSFVVSNVFDLAGNPAGGQPYTGQFATLDTIGPVITNLQIIAGELPVANSTVSVVAALATNESGATVSFTQDFTPIGTATNPPYLANVMLPATGTTTIRAIATDRYGNNGQLVPLVLHVQPPQPPLIHFALLSPTNSPITNGASVLVDVTASGDTGISNLTAIFGSGATGAVATVSGPEVHVQGVVLSTASPDQPVQVFASAIDNLGISSGEQIFNLPIVDTVAPALAILSPTNNGHLPNALSFNLATVVSDNSTNVTLNLSISGSIAVTQTVAVTLVPNVPLTNNLPVSLAAAPTNGGPIVATLTATDAASNTTSLTQTFWLANTPGPGINSLVIASNIPPLAGFTVPIVAMLDTNEPGVTVQFTQDSKLIGVATNSPYQVTATLPASGSTTIRAIAIDQYGNTGVAEQLVLTVQPNVQPSVQFVRVTPPAGPIPSGSTFEVDLTASGNSNVFNITGSVGGAATPAAFATNGSTLRLFGSVPATATAGQQIQINGQAVDTIGQSTGPKGLTLSVSDGTPPSLALLSPAANDQLSPGGMLTLTSQVSDNSTNVTLTVVVTGYLTTTQMVSVALTPNTVAQGVINVPLPNEPTNGSPLTATLTATDGAGNSTSLSRVFWLPGTLTTVTWERQAFGQSFPCTNGGSYTWPNNNNWSQSEQFGIACNPSVLVEVAPSNWSTTNAPNADGLDVILGNLGGAPANLDIAVSIHSLTIQTNGGLNMAGNTSLTAVNYDFQGDGGITTSGSPPRLNLNGGTMEKSGGTNAFVIDSTVTLASSNGTFAVDSGTLALPDNGSSYTSGGAFNVASNATLVLDQANRNITMAGPFTGSGSGTVLLNTGTLSSGAGGVTLDLPAPLFQWSGGVMNGTLTNNGAITLTGSSDLILLNQSILSNNGKMLHEGSGRFGLNGNGGGLTEFNNLAGGVYDFLTDGSVFLNNCCGNVYFNNEGLVLKSGGTNTSAISITFNNLGGRIQVDSGTLTLNNGGSSSDGTVAVAAGAALDLTGGSSPVWQGTLTGTGAGHVLLSSGILQGAPSLALNFAPGVFQWSGGVLAGQVTNLGSITLSGTIDSIIFNQARLFNAGQVLHTGSGRLGLNGNGAGLTTFDNLASGTYQFLTDSSVFLNNCCGTVQFNNYGLLWKSGGTNMASISGISFDNLGGTIRVDSGQLALTAGSSVNGTFTVAAGASVDLTGGLVPTWAGTIRGGGLGAINLSHGIVVASPSLTLAFTNNLFQWDGGMFAGTVTNLGIATLTGDGDSFLFNQAQFINAGQFIHQNNGRLGYNGNGGGLTAFDNLAGATYEFLADGGVFQNNCCGTLQFNNQGLLWKAGGTNLSSIAGISFNNLGGTIRVDSGALSLTDGNSVNGTFNVAAGASVDLTGGGAPVWTGLMTGGGGGQVQLNHGTLFAAPSLTLNFTNNTFQWDGGFLRGTITNAGTVNISGAADSILLNQSLFYNAGKVLHVGTGQLGLNGNGGGLTAFNNLATGVYEFRTDSSIFLNNCCGTMQFNNQGLLWKSAGTNLSSVGGISFNNLGGTIRVDSGELSLFSGASANGTFIVAAGATLDLTGGSTPVWSGTMTGAGAGAVVLSSGVLSGAPGLTLNFTNNLFQWSGGVFAGTITNTGIVTLTGSNDSLLANQAVFYNAGQILHEGSGRVGFNGNGGGFTAIENLPTGVYKFTTDSSVFLNNCCGDVEFVNQGLLWKSGGTNTSSITGVTFNNQGGSIQVDSGTLSVATAPFVQGGGAFTFTLGGTNAGQFGQFTAGNVTLGGALHVKLAPGFAAPVGAQFQIISCTSLTGTFSSLDVPAGLQLSYVANGVILTVTTQFSGRTATQLPVLFLRAGGPNQAALTWGAGASNFILESATSLKPGALWTPYTNLFLAPSNGAYNVTLPVSNSARFFRLRKP